MKLIVGLGNPGAEYASTRHNAGYMAIDRLARRSGLHGPARARFHGALVEGPIRGVKCVLLKPTVYMNRSGTSVAEAVGFYKADPSEDLLVLVDDVALPCGTIRIRPGGGPGGHNGLKDIQARLGTDRYPRLRIGIDAKPAYMDDQADYVLGRFTPEQLTLVEPALDRAASAAETFAAEGLDSAMNRFNTREDSGADPTDGPEPPPVHPGWLG